jgi:hypothetical protein
MSVSEPPISSRTSVPGRQSRSFASAWGTVKETDADLRVSFRVSATVVPRDGARRVPG